VNVSLLTRAVILVILAVEIASLPVAARQFHQIAFNQDGANFWSAGATVGTAALLDPAAHAAWQIAHHLNPQAFVYIPGWAWFLKPFAYLPPLWGLIVADVVMLAVAFIGSQIAARVYGLSTRIALLIVLAWYPVLYGIEVGQFAPLAMLLSLLVAQGLAAKRPALSGVAAGALLYKPTFGVVFVLFLLARREWRALAIAGACAACWYVLSVAATAGDWTWPVHYAQTLAGYYHADYAMNARKSMTLPTILIAFGVSPLVAFASGIAVLVIGAWGFVKRPLLEAVSFAGVIGLVASPHAWPYDLTMFVPAICYVAARSPRLREAILLPAYVLAGTWWLTIWWLPFNPLALLTLGAFALWLLFTLRSARSIRRMAWQT
jgi:Glycosyltransferase family 87